MNSLEALSTRFDSKYMHLKWDKYMNLFPIMIQTSITSVRNVNGHTYFYIFKIYFAFVSNFITFSFH